MEEGERQGEKRPHHDSSAEGEEERKEAKRGKRGAGSQHGIVRLAFPPLTPTLDERSLKLILDAVSEFLDDEGSKDAASQPFMQLLLVVPTELDEGCRTLLRAAGALAAEGGGQGEESSTSASPARFMAVTGDLTRLKDAGLESQVLACPCDPRFLPRGHDEVIARVNAAAGPELESSSRLLQGKADENKPLAVRLTNRSQLAVGQGVSFVIQVLPPPNVAGDEEEQGAGYRLKQAYARMLNCFRGLLPRLLPVQAPSTPTDQAPSSPSALPAASPTADVAVLRVEDVPTYRHPGPAAPLGGAWDQALYQFLRSPHGPSIFLDLPQCLVVYDGYRKARVHLLLLPKPAFLDLPDVASARPAHLPRLRALHDIARTIAQAVQQQQQQQQQEGGKGDNEVRLGYHALPSLRPLHLHVISQDFDSPHLKNKKHWNTFTTPFFVSPHTLEDALAGPAGRLRIDRSEYEALEKGPLRCHRCHVALANMPKLKDHIANCNRRPGR